MEPKNKPQYVELELPKQMNVIDESEKLFIQLLLPDSHDFKEHVEALQIFVNNGYLHPILAQSGPAQKLNAQDKSVQPNFLAKKSLNAAVCVCCLNIFHMTAGDGLRSSQEMLDHSIRGCSIQDM